MNNISTIIGKAITVFAWSMALPLLVALSILTFSVKNPKIPGMKDEEKTLFI
jgi:hypothetical protein